MKAYQILLYYCYTPITDTELFREEHHLYCLENNLKGRIIVASEGLNGTVSGLREDCERYRSTLKADPRFSEIDFKVEAHHQHAFEKLHVRVKPEIVHSGFKHIDPNVNTGIHLAPKDFKVMKEQEDVVLLDCRSNYEHESGRFRGAITMDIENFRDMPGQLEQLQQYKDKKVITYCTGGIKCEKASAYLLEQGFENVYQLHGGIINYGIEEGGEDFEGSCYVFDNRVVAEVNSINPKIISKCHICGTPSTHMVNCANPVCNLHVHICERCGWEYEGACSETCVEHPKKRDYDGTGYYPKEMNGRNPYKS